MNKPDELTQPKEPSEEYKKFESLLKQVVSVPKSEIDASIKAEREQRRKNK